MTQGGRASGQNAEMLLQRLVIDPPSGLLSPTPLPPGPGPPGDTGIGAQGSQALVFVRRLPCVIGRRPAVRLLSVLIVTGEYWAGCGLHGGWPCPAGPAPSSGLVAPEPRPASLPPTFSKVSHMGDKEHGHAALEEASQLAGPEEGGGQAPLRGLAC